MYLFYSDESGSSDPAVAGVRADGSTFRKDHIHVLLAVSLFERRWNGFERTINTLKLQLLRGVSRATRRRLELTDAEVHSNVIRRAGLRGRHPLFGFLTSEQLSALTTLFYQQLEYHHMHLFAVVIDKRKLASYMDQEKLKRKAYELLLERIQSFLQEFHSKHFGVIVADDVSVQSNRSLALKHSWFQRSGTTSTVRLRNIVEMPFFVRSELSNGIQLADLCAYDVYRAFRYEQPGYEYFRAILPRFYQSQATASDKIDGLKVFPDDSDLVAMVQALGRELNTTPQAEP